MGPRLVWRDLRRIVQGIDCFVRYLRSPQTIEIALGTFEAESPAVVRGRSCRYVIRIANVSEKVWDVTLALEVCASISGSAAAKPSARFAKRCLILPGRATEIEFHYDWQTTAMFISDQVASPPDEGSVGEIKALQLYRVSAILCDHTGNHLDTLEIYQELKG